MAIGGRLARNGKPGDRETGSDTAVYSEGGTIGPAASVAAM